MDTNKERFYILGLIRSQNYKGKEFIEAMVLYNPYTDEQVTESLQSIQKRVDTGAQVLGTRIKTIRRFSRDTLILYHEMMLTKLMYDYTKLPILNGCGEIIEPGKDVVICKVDDDKYLVMNSKFQKRYLTKQEIIKENLVGVVRNSIARESQILIEREAS